MKPHAIQPPEQRKWLTRNGEVRILYICIAGGCCNGVLCTENERRMKVMLKGLRKIIALGCLGLITCSHGAALGTVIVNPPNPGTPSLLPGTSRLIMFFGARKVMFQASMWQNFMPPIDSQEPQVPIHMVVAASELSSRGLPAGFNLTGVRVWRGNKVYWRGELTRNGEADGEAYIVRNGMGAFALPANGRVHLTVLYTVGKRKGSVTFPNFSVGAVY